MIVADTDVLIDALRGRSPSADRVDRELGTGALATTAVTAFELRSGAGRRKEREAVEKLLAAIPILPLDDEAADRAAAVRRELEGRGTGLGMADYLIAGICLTRAAVLPARVFHPGPVPRRHLLMAPDT